MRSTLLMVATLMVPLSAFADRVTCLCDGYALQAINNAKTVKGQQRLGRVVISDTVKARGERTIANVPAKAKVKVKSKLRNVKLVTGNIANYAVDVSEALDAEDELFSVDTSEAKLAGILIDEITEIAIEAKDFNFSSPDSKANAYTGKMLISYDDGEDPEEKPVDCKCTYSQQE